MSDLHNNDNPAIIRILEELSKGNTHFKEVYKKVESIDNVNYIALSISLGFALDNMRQRSKWFTDFSEDHFVNEVFKIYNKIK